MFLPPAVKIFMSAKPIDMRKGFNGLCAIVRSQWKQDVFSGHLFVFLGSRYDRVKVLHWDKGGFVLYYKRLERGRFKKPRVTANGLAIELDSTQLIMLLDGIDYQNRRKIQRWVPKVQKLT